MRKNPDQRTVDLRAKYRANHGDDWWQDEEIKAEYRAERREIYRDGAPSDPTGKGSRPSQQKSTASKRKRSKRTASKFQKKLSHFGRHPTGSTKKQLSETKAKKIAKQALNDLGIEVGRWTSIYGGQGFGAKVKNGTLDGQKVKIVIGMHADYWDVAFMKDQASPKGLLSEVGGVYHFYAQKEFGDLVKLMANYYIKKWIEMEVA